MAEERRYRWPEVERLSMTRSPNDESRIHEHLVRFALEMRIYCACVAICYCPVVQSCANHDCPKSFARKRPGPGAEAAWGRVSGKTRRAAASRYERFFRCRVEARMSLEQVDGQSEAICCDTVTRLRWMLIFRSFAPDLNRLASDINLMQARTFVPTTLSSCFSNAASQIAHELRSSYERGNCEDCTLEGHQSKSESKLFERKYTSAPRSKQQGRLLTAPSKPQKNLNVSKLWPESARRRKKR
ncbi:hypothetical protein MRB53_038674 [Persea americana]|nr:hypothetical protein MRB53_038674 [Persea americana]